MLERNPLPRTSNREHWFFTPVPNPEAPMRLLCFPYAGGNASFARTWPRGLPADVEVCSLRLPGRAPRAHERPFERVEPLVEVLLDVVASLLDRPYVLFGHSYGGLIAYLLARRVGERGLPKAEAIIVSATPSPASHGTVSKMSELGDDDLCRALTRLGGVSQAVLREPELRDLFVPIIRSDLMAVDSYVPDLGAVPLDIPLWVFGAERDDRVPPHRLDGWADVTRARYSRQIFPGGHFYLHDDEPRFLQTLSSALIAINETRKGRHDGPQSPTNSCR